MSNSGYLKMHWAKISTVQNLGGLHQRWCALSRPKLNIPHIHIFLLRLLFFLVDPPARTRTVPRPFSVSLSSSLARMAFASWEIFHEETTAAEGVSAVRCALSACLPREEWGLETLRRESFCQHSPLQAPCSKQKFIKTLHNFKSESLSQPLIFKEEICQRRDLFSSHFQSF